MFGDKRVIDEGAFDRAQAGITERNKNAYQNYKKALEDSYDYSRGKGGFYGTPLLNKFVEGMTGGGWTKSDFMSKYGIDSDVDAAGQAGLLNKTSMDSLYQTGNNYSNQRLKDFAARKNLASGVPILGEILNPVFQTFSVAPDLISSGTEKWDKGERDTVSDIGAGIETLLDIATLGSMAGVGGAAKAAPTTLKAAVANAAKRSAIVGGVGSLGDYLRTTGKDASVGDAAVRTALGAGIGGAFGGAMGGLGYGIGKLRSNAITGNQKVAEAAAAAQKAQSDVTAYQDAMKAAKDLGLDTSSSEALKNSYRAYSVANHPDKAGNVVALLPSSTANSGAMTAQEAQNLVNTINQNAVNAATAAQSEAGNIYNTLYNANLSDLLSTSKSAQSALKKASNQALLDYLKGTKLGKLGSSKLGKAAAVGGAAYGISRLLGNRNGGNNE